MTRRYHSPSSIALGGRCQHAWALNYLDHIRDPKIEWRPELERPLWDHGLGLYVLPDGTKVTAAQRGSALGDALHGTAERYFDPSRGTPDWDWFPGRVLRSGIHHLPRPAAIEWAKIESSIGRTPLPDRGPGKPAHDREPVVGLAIAGIMWAGYRDLLTYAPDEWRRLKVTAPDGLVITDYKTTSSISERALTAEELAADPQGNIYGIDLCEERGLRSVPARWVYFENKRVRRSIAVDAVFELSRGYDIISPLADLARTLDKLTCSADAEKNADACSDYGAPDRINCRHHVVNGGTCNARRPMGPLVQIRTSKDETKMALSAEKQAAFDAKRLAAKAAKDAGASDAPPADDAPTDTTDAPADDKPAAPTKPKPSAPPSAKPGSAAMLIVLAKELEQHEKAADGVRAKIRAAVA